MDSLTKIKLETIRIRHSMRVRRMDGGPGSGNWGHKGVKGQLGGSAPSSGKGLSGGSTPSPGEVTSGKGGIFKPKSEGAKRIDTSDAAKEVADGMHNSLEEHMDDKGNLSEERQAVHDQIIKDFFAEKLPAKGTPQMIMSGGGPASGKTFIRKEAEKEFGEETTVTIDPDDFKARLPGYEEMAKKDDKAAAFYHEESSALAKRAYQYAADNNVNVVYDGTGDGSIKSVESKIAIARDAGYKVVGKYVTVDTEEALRRNLGRYLHAKEEYESGKSTVPPRLPEESVVRATHQKVSDISAQVADRYDEFYLYDNNVQMGESPIYIAHCSRGGNITSNPGMETRLQKYLDKGKMGFKVENGKVKR